MKLIVGLGNPGKKYEHTRHNAGFLFLNFLSAHKAGFHTETQFSGQTMHLTLHNQKFLLAKPQTFMNDSGLAVQKIMAFYKIPDTNLLVVHDDKDIPLGEYRLQQNRGAAGHNGVKSIIQHLGTQDFLRLRLGVAPDHDKIDDTPEFVLGNFSKEEEKLLFATFEKVIKETDFPSF